MDLDVKISLDQSSPNRYELLALVEARLQNDGRWCVQLEKLTTEMISYDYMGRFETFQHDFRILLESLGADDCLTIRCN